MCLTEVSYNPAQSLIIVTTRMSYLLQVAFWLLFSITHNGLTFATTEPNVHSHGMLMVCYVTSWSNYRPGSGRFTVDMVDGDQCTHLIYSFAGLDNSSYTIQILDREADLDASENGKEGGYKKMYELKRKYPHLRILLAVGGWNEGSEKYSTMVSSYETRKVFIKSTVNLLRKYNFDGLDLDWEYPANRGGKPEDKENFVLLLKELQAEFRQYKWLLSVAIGISKTVINTAYDIPNIDKHTDFINIMAYDYWGGWEKTTGFNAPLFGQPTENSVNSSITYLKSLGANPNKLVLGLPMYGRTFTLDEPDSNGAGAPATKGPKGPYTREDNYMGYIEICEKIQASSWKKFFNGLHKVPYAYEDRTWISYDDIDSLTLKVKLAMEERLGGVMAWPIDTDDFIGNCHGISFPLLKAVNQAIIKYQPIGGNEIPDSGKTDSSPKITHNALTWIIVSLCMIHMVSNIKFNGL